MKNNAKISAFTLSEMVVVIILTSLVVGIAFSVLSLVQKNMFSIKQNFNNNTELSKLEQALWIDFNSYSRITYNAIEDELIFISELDSTSYRFTNNYIIKESDTLSIQLKDKLFFLNGDKTENDELDAIKLETQKTFQRQQIFVYKVNDANLYMN
ncbi:hypothetical protein [uncultured Algibacter sp.]|uniref:PulJ/GspJ family protein n=1 Tax=uncultured Algibacter sp. TaxID=298659 RepID=UPI002638E1BD|nr:hypothetical protein [uncultured Algibacter sp.]